MTDGSVAITRLVPVGIKLAAGEELTINRVKELGDGFAIAGPDTGWIAVTQAQLHGDEPMANGIELLFSPVERELSRWPEEMRTRIVSHHKIATAPDDRSYRNAWALDGAVIVHDMPKARDLHRDKLRAERAKLFTILDVEYMRADEAGDTQKKQEFSARKQALRNVTEHPSIDAAESIDDLKLITVAIA